MEDKVKIDDELLDLVDENDNVVGEVLKSEAHKNPRLIHRVIGGILFDDNNRVLLQKRSYLKGSDPGVWITSWAGHVGKGCSPEDAAHRELL